MRKSLTLSSSVAFVAIIAIRQLLTKVGKSPHTKGRGKRQSFVGFEDASVSILIESPMMQITGIFIFY